MSNMRTIKCCIGQKDCRVWNNMLPYNHILSKYMSIKAREFYKKYYGGKCDGK